MSDKIAGECPGCKKPVDYYSVKVPMGNQVWHDDCFRLAEPFRPAKYFEDLLRSSDEPAIVWHVIQQFIGPTDRALILSEYNRLKKAKHEAYHARLREKLERDNRTDQAGQARAGTAAQDEEIVS